MAHFYEFRYNLEIRTFIIINLIFKIGYDYLFFCTFHATVHVFRGRVTKISKALITQTNSQNATSTKDYA